MFLDTHQVIIDQEDKLLSWVTQSDAYARVASLSWDFLLNTSPIEAGTGKKVYFAHSEYNPTTYQGTAWPNNPAGKNAMLSESAALFYAFSGDGRVLELAKSLLDHQLQFGTTPSTHNWASVPYSTAAAGSLTYGNDTQVEGTGVIEPDKVAELGHDGYLTMYKITGDTRYRDAAIACANELASNIRSGTSTISPWPFRVNAQTGAVVENYSAHVIPAIQLFDELIRLNLGNVASYTSARSSAWNWLIAIPVANARWTQYFEDVPIQSNQFANLNQYAPGQTAIYMLQNQSKNANWKTHVETLSAFIINNFGGDDFGDPGIYRGARVISEQIEYKYKMASHTSRYGAMMALYAAATGDATAKDTAYRSLNWASYMARNNGSVNEGPAEFVKNPAFWFTDGHGDYVRHFMIAMGAFPEWAPSNENHIVHSTSVVKTVAYSSTAVTWETFDVSSTETLRLARPPTSVSLGGVNLSQRADLNAPGWTFDPVLNILRVRHDTAGAVVVTLGS